MEAASRPPLELLPDLPVEAPVDTAAPRVEPISAPTSPPPAAGIVPAAGKSPAPSRDPEQTGLNFVDPEMFLAPGQAPTAVPAGGTTTTAKLPEDSGELVLEDPVVDDVLTAPVAPSPRQAGAPERPAGAAGGSADKAAGGTPASAPLAAGDARPSARVPIARTASLQAAATKLAAASAAAAQAKPKPTVSAPPRAAAASPAPTPIKPTAKPAVPSAAPAAASPAGKPGNSKAESTNLAGWANARATPAPATPKASAPTASAAAVVGRSNGTTPAAHVGPSNSAAAGAASAGAARGAAPKIAGSAPPPSGTVPGMPAPPPMDRDFIARNQVVERYLSGRLPLKGATDFERFCHDHPELLDEIGLPERVNAGLRLLEASGKPEPWQENPRPPWQKPQVTLALAAAVLALAVALGVVASGNASKSRRIVDLEKQSAERALDPATSTREIRLLPSRVGASNTPAITIGGGGITQLADFKIDESRSPYHAFRVTIDRIDQGRVGVINNLAKDSNGHLRIALNSSALGPGNYQLTLEGLDWRGDPQPDSWVTIGIAH